MILRFSGCLCCCIYSVCHSLSADEIRWWWWWWCPHDVIANDSRAWARFIVTAYEHYENRGQTLLQNLCDKLVQAMKLFYVMHSRHHFVAGLSYWNQSNCWCKAELFEWHHRSTSLIDKSWMWGANLSYNSYRLYNAPSNPSITNLRRLCTTESNLVVWPVVLLQALHLTRAASLI